MSIQFFKTGMGRKFFETTLPELVEAIKGLTKATKCECKEVDVFNPPMEHDLYDGELVVLIHLVEKELKNPIYKKPDHEPLMLNATLEKLKGMKAHEKVDQNA